MSTSIWLMVYKRDHFSNHRSSFYHPNALESISNSTISQLSGMTMNSTEVLNLQATSTVHANDAEDQDYNFNEMVLMMFCLCEYIDIFSCVIKSK